MQAKCNIDSAHSPVPAPTCRIHSNSPEAFGEAFDRAGLFSRCVDTSVCGCGSRKPQASKPVTPFNSTGCGLERANYLLLKGLLKHPFVRKQCVHGAIASLLLVQQSFLFNLPRFERQVSWRQQHVGKLRK